MNNYKESCWLCRYSGYRDGWGRLFEDKELKIYHICEIIKPKEVRDQEKCKRKKTKKHSIKMGCKKRKKKKR